LSAPPPPGSHTNTKGVSMANRITASSARSATDYEFLPNDVREDFGSWLYWDADLRA